MTATSSGGHAAACDHLSIIKRQFDIIEQLETQIATIRLERDSLLVENERLCFQLQMLECLKTRHDDSPHDQSDDQHRPRPATPTAASRVELSQQLVAAQLSALERKYGGAGARAAAVTIQRAFRAYRMRRRFKSIAVALAAKQRDSGAAASDRLSSSSESESAPAVAADVRSASESARKRRYRVALNLLNKSPEKGVAFLLANGFIERSAGDALAKQVAHFLLSRKGVSKATVGEYLANAAPFQAAVLRHFAREIDFCEQELDVALRRFQTYFRFPGEAQKIERLVEAFAARFVECNPSGGVSRDQAFVLAFAVIMLNTDLHCPALKDAKRMTAAQFVANLRGVFGDDAHPPEQQLTQIYDRIKNNEFRTGADHVTQVLKVQHAVVGKDVPALALPHRRLVCYCRLYEIRDPSKRDRHGQHQREVFLFNDLLLVTKLTARAKSSHVAEYQFRSALALDGLAVTLFSSPNHRFGIRLSRRVDDRILALFNARNDLDRTRFVDDLHESIAETDEMEALRMASVTKSSSLLMLNRGAAAAAGDAEAPAEAAVRRGSSSGSLDSGLSLSRDQSPQQKKI